MRAWSAGPWFALCLVAVSHAGAATLKTADGLGAEAAGGALAKLSLGGRALEGVAVSAEVQHPRTREPVAKGFRVAAAWRAAGGCLRLEGEVVAEGTADVAADLVVRVAGAKLALSTLAADPLLQPRKLLSKLPLVSLRVGGRDALALAVPPDRLAAFGFRQAEDAVELRWRFGFTAEARPRLKMRAPFACVVYRTDPAWHFRSALARYYALFPEPFQPFVRKQGGWFFAAPTRDLPNPQHFAYHEGGPRGWEDDHARGMGTYPYRESSSCTISLTGDTLPRDHDEAMRRFAALEARRTLADWSPASTHTVDDAVKRSGTRSLLADSAAGAWTGGRQAVALEPAYSKPILVKGFSRADGVSGPADNDYSIYVDVCYADGSYLFGQCATFAPGTHDWQEAAKIIKPERPVSELRVYCLLRGRKGRAWFDDLQVGPLDKPRVNWLRNPGFEAEGRNPRFQYIRDNACLDVQGRYVVRITDNFSADVKPTRPLNLLRFTLNVDPDVPSTDEHPAVGAREIAHWDKLFAASPDIDGCYVDSVSGWCAGRLNFRRGHWRYHDAPFTYHSATLRVAPHGRFAMQKYLRRLQQRYHPSGKTIFTNIHVSLNSFPLYLVSDVPGIESSRFQDEDWLFFHRASSHQKPLLLLNFMNLHGLDRRDVAEAYHLNAAMWGEFPSTGRYVQRAYREYGDVTHAWMPVVKELSAAGWEPIPLADGVRVERFGRQGAVYFAVRAPKEPGEQTLRIRPEALAKLGLPVRDRTQTGLPVRDRTQTGTGLVAFDAVWLHELPLRKDGGGWAVPFSHGAEQLHVVRISGRGAIAPWLLARARRHAGNAARVRGKASETPEILKLNAVLAKGAAAWRRALDAALHSAGGPKGGLFAQSRRRELLQARQALHALAVFQSGAELGLSGPRMGTPGLPLRLVARASAGQGAKARLVALSSAPGRCIVPRLEPVAAKEPPAAAALAVESKQPATAHVRAVFEVTPAGQPPVRVERLAHVFFLPVAQLSVSKAGTSAEAHTFAVRIERRRAGVTVTLRARAEPFAKVEPKEMRVNAEQAVVRFAVTRVLDGLHRTLTVTAADAKGNELARATAAYWDEAAPPAADLALARLGARASTESNYPGGYNPAPLIDGTTSRAGLHWTAHAWASRDNSQPHWVQIDLPKPQAVSQVWVYWAIDGKRTHTARRYTIVGVTAAGRKVLLEVKDQPVRTVSLHRVPPTAVKAIRIEQPANGGPAARPGIMWIREVCLVP